MPDRIEEIIVTPKLRGSSSSTIQIVPEVQKVDITTDIEDNILDKFDLPTYHLKFYMMGDNAIRNGIFGPKAKDQRVIIAESGVTIIDIDELEIKTVPGISKAAGIGTSTEFSFTLREPFGATLLDQISDAAKFLEVKNFAKIPFYLEISFRARKAGDDSAQLPGALGELEDLVWTYPMMLTQMALDVSTGGSVYAMKAAFYGDIAYTNQVFDAEKTITVDALTVGDWVTGLQKSMNLRGEEKKETANYKAVDTYEFFVDEKIAKALIVPDLIEERKDRAGTYLKEDGKMTFTFHPGISVDRMVENILSLTTLFQKIVPELNADGTVDEPTFKKLYRVIADTTMGEYDETRSDYARHFRYLIIPYEMSTITTPDSEGSTQGDEELYQAKVEKGLIKKIYNYIYTGLNDQVLDFELVFNFNWYAALPLQAGRSTNPAAAEPKTVLTDEQAEALHETADKINQLRSFLANPAGFAPISVIEDALAEFLSPLTDEIDLAKNKVDAATTDISDVIGEAIADADAALEPVHSGIEGVPEVIPGVAEVRGVSNTISGAAAGAGSLTDRLVAGTQLSRLKTPKIASPSAAQDDLRERDIFLDDPRIGQKVEAIFKQSLTETATGANAATIAQGSQTAGRTMLSALFEQAKGPIAADLLDIDLNIKGDPYWLEPPPTHRNAAPRSTLDRMLADRGFIDGGDSAEEGDTEESKKGTVTPNFTTANASNAQTYMVFRSFTPQQFSATTGITPAGKKVNNVLNGVYAIRMVTHIFTGGVFTQTLHGIRDVRINLANVNLLAHLGVASPTVPTDVQASAEQAFANQTTSLVDGEGKITAIGGDPALTTIERVTEGFDLTGGLLDVLEPEKTPVGPTPAPETDNDG